MPGKTSFVLDANLSDSLILLFFTNRRSEAVTAKSAGLRKDADDLEVIDLAFRTRAILVTTDQYFANKCKQFQLQHGCMFGLIILPDGIEKQRRILDHIRRKKKVLRFHKLSRALSWADIKDFNFLVRARELGHPHVLELCNCEVWNEH